MLPRNINKNPPAHSPFLGLVPVKVNGNVKIALVKVFPSLPTNQTRITYVRTYVRIACSCCRVRRYVFCRSVLYPFKDILLSRVPMSRSQHQGRHAVVVRQVQRGLVHPLCDSQRSVLP